MSLQNETFDGFDFEKQLENLAEDVLSLVLQQTGRRRRKLVEQFVTKLEKMLPQMDTDVSCALKAFLRRRERMDPFSSN